MTEQADGIRTQIRECEISIAALKAHDRSESEITVGAAAALMGGTSVISVLFGVEVPPMSFPSLLLAGGAFYYFDAKAARDRKWNERLRLEEEISRLKRSL